MGVTIISSSADYQQGCTHQNELVLKPHSNHVVMY